MKSFEVLSLCIGHDSEVMADVLNYKAITLRRWKQDPLQSGSQNPLDVLEGLINTALELGRQKSEALAPINYLVRRFTPSALPCFDTSIHSAFADLMLELSHLTTEYSAAIRDGKVVPEERRRLQRESAHLRERLDEFDRVLQVSEKVEG